MFSAEIIFFRNRTTHYITLTVKVIALTLSREINKTVSFDWLFAARVALPGGAWVQSQSQTVKQKTFNKL